MSQLSIRLLIAVVIVPLTVIFFYSHSFAQQAANPEAAKEPVTGKTGQPDSSTTPLADPQADPKAGEKPSGDAKGTKIEESKTEFTRIRNNEAGEPVAFETSVTRYQGKNEKGVEFTVDLVGAVHIGEKSYYEELNKEFEQYESLLYELVAPKGTVIEKGMKRDNSFSVISGFQRGMKNMLGLDFQLDHIDYTKKNFVHADMSPEEFKKSMKANDESVMKMMFKMMGHSMGAKGSSGTISDGDILGALFSNDRELTMRRLLAQQLQNGDVMLSVFEGKDGSTIITHRNRKALDVLKEELKNGKTNIGIFYGAGHFPEMEETLIEDFKVRKTGEKWITAWSLEDPKAKRKRGKKAKE